MNKTQKLRQRDQILRHLRDRGSATVYELVLEYNIMSPTRRITDLRQAGYPIKSITEYRTNSYGEKVKYTRWELDKTDTAAQMRMKI